MAISLQEQVKKLAYELYEKNGRREGSDLLDWLAAEQIIRFQEKIFSGMGDEAVGLLEYKPMSDAGGKVRAGAALKSRSQKPFRGGRRGAGKMAQ